MVWPGLMVNLDSARFSGVGHGKLILFGEHAVVYGVPAIVSGLDQGAVASLTLANRSQVTLVRPDGTHILSATPDPAGEPLPRALAALFSSFGDVQACARVTMNVPLGVGMGSSAALAASLSRALADATGSPEVINDAVAASEAVFHGNASGIDQAAAVRGGTFRFVRGAPAQIDAINVQPFRLVVAQAGPPALTSTMVGGVGDRLLRIGAVGERLLDGIREVVASAATALRRGDLASLGELMNVNHGMLVALGVSTPLIEVARGVACDAGAWGAKLTGAGGGGSVIVIAPEPDDVIAALCAAGFQAFDVVIS